MRDLSELPDGWRVVQLGDVAAIAFSGVDKKKMDSEIPVQLCNYTDVFYNRLIGPGMPFMEATATAKEHKRWSLKRGDVLFTKDSETPDEIGIAAYVTDTMPNVLCGYHLGMARPRPTVVEGQFLAEALGSQASRREFARVANGITRFGLTLDATRSLPILLHRCRNSVLSPPCWMPLTRPSNTPRRSSAPPSACATPCSTTSSPAAFPAGIPNGAACPAWESSRQTGKSCG